MNARHLLAKSRTFDGINPSHGFWRFIMRHRSAALNLSLLIALISCNDAALTAPGSQPVSTSECTIGVDCQATTAGYPPIPAVEIELLTLINAERALQGPPRPALERDLGMDRIILWHVTEMAKQKFLSHTDKQGRRSEARARAYGDDPQIRCLEIIQWWGGTPSGRVHDEGYNASPSHRAGYLEQAPYSLGPTKWAGVAAVAGTGPEGSAFEGRPGSYTGVLLCEHRVTLSSDPFETSGN
ncbi:MAG: hypothetical protein O7F70_00305 [Gemmatimonadetes bacterium]|nr:hypothetical protein [Gemmatimonadota bacterium]